MNTKLPSCSVAGATDARADRAEDALGVYLHLPYCRTKCVYCAFVSGAPRSEGEMDRYMAALVRHIEAGATLARGRTVTSVFFGGGTPSLMGANRMARLFEALQRAFHIASDAEITIEANPESATRELFERLIPLGLNRVSLGAQSFIPAELERLGRVHSAKDTERAVQCARDCGLASVSLDVIYGLPWQTSSRWRETVDCALECSIDHLSAYALSYEEGTLLHRQMERGAVTPIPDESFEEMYSLLQERMQQRGWRQYEISNWSLPGRESRHNILYWKRDDYLAFGVSAHGKIDETRYGLLRDPNRYMSWIESQPMEPPFDALHPQLLEERTALTSVEAASDGMIFGLRLLEGVSLAEFERRYGFAPADRWGEAIEQLIARGLLEEREGRLRLRKERLLLSNEAFEYFLD